MTNSDHKQFTQQLTILAECFSKQLNPGIIMAYFNDLSEFSMTQVTGAIERARKSLDRWPVIAQLRSLCLENSNRLLPDEAWAEVLSEMQRTCGTQLAPSFTSPDIQRAVDSIGGLHTIWYAGTEQEGYNRHAFIKAYSGLVQRDDVARLQGLPTRQEAAESLEYIRKSIVERETQRD